MAFTHSKLAEVTVGASGVASIDFNNIPQNYNDLQVVISCRKSTGNFPNPIMQFNGDTGLNYRYRGLYGDGANAASNNSTSSNSILFGVMTGSSETASTFGSGQAYIPNYTSNTAKSISIESLGETNATTAYSYFVATLWTGTSAITNIKILPGAADNFVQHSTATLYGVKAEV